ncbi:MAG: PAS domain S-box protein [Deltaproteobacteria bacterium]|nr:PAS domain S-box protein [Deltaproteobacteria bacterium]
MSHAGKTKDELLAELGELRLKISDLEKEQMEWKRSKEKLIESEQNFRAISENANDGILIAAGEGLHVFANERAAEITGYPVSELLETTIKDLAHPDDFDEIMKRYRNIVEGMPFSRQYETRMIRKDGKALPVEVASARTAWQGQPADIVILRDITERKQAEAALRESEARLRTAIESLPFDFFFIDQTGRYVMQNSTCRENWGNLLGKRPEDLEVDEETLALWTNNNSRAFGGEVVEGEVSFKAGEEKRYYHNIISPIHEGGKIQGILGVNIDISQRKKAENAIRASQEELEQQVEQRTADLLQANRKLHREIQERSRAEQALRQSEEHFRSIFEKSQDAICLIDDEGYFHMVNEAMCDLTGVSRQELINKHYSAFMDKETYDLMEQYWQQRKRDEPAPSRYEFTLFRPDGDIRIVENVPTVVRFSDKSPLTLAILRDVTRRRQMEDALDSMRSKLLNLQESERRTISRVLHDTIGQNISILDFNLTTIAEMVDETSLEKIKGLIENMRSVIRETGDKLRDISSGLHPRIVQELGLMAGINNLIDRLRRATGLEVETSVVLDESQIEESVASNLYRIVQEAFTNIVKHSKCSAVSFEMDLADSRLAMVIKDNGQGFDMEDVNRREIERRGMGIFIMTERVKAMGGKLHIVSKPNRGTQLQVEVPLTMA